MGSLLIACLIVLVAIALGKPKSLIKSQLIKLLIVFAFIFQLLVVFAFCFDPLHGPFDNAYRHEERWKAYSAWKQNPSALSKAEYDYEMSRLDAYLGTRDMVIFMVLVAEVAGACFVWQRLKRLKA